MATLDDAAFWPLRHQGNAEVRLCRPIRPPNGPAQCADQRFFAYSDNYLIDVKVGIIMDVEVVALHPPGGRSAHRGR